MLDFAEGAGYKRGMKTTTNPETLTLKLDGRPKTLTFTIASGSLERGILSLRGSRGGEKGLVRNVHSGAWRLCTGNRAELVEVLNGERVLGRA